MKNISILATILLSFHFLFIGCASTKITSFKDPDYQNSNFKRILIVANTNDLENRKLLETTMVELFRKEGIFALESYKLFPPTREFTSEEKVSLMLNNKIDAYISISVGESGVSEVYIPQTSTTTNTEGNVNVYGNEANYRQKSTTTYEGGYTVKKPWAKITTNLYDVSNGQKAWIANSFTGGNAYANKKTIVNSYCKKIIGKLLEDGLITKLNIE
ncbi:MAG: hypothetical protein ACYDA4_03825 [Ignavibacteriaceae bacterium]